MCFGVSGKESEAPGGPARGGRLGQALVSQRLFKCDGQKIEAPREREPSKVANHMDALRRSVETKGAARGERRSDLMPIPDPDVCDVGGSGGSA